MKKEVQLLSWRFLAWLIVLTMLFSVMPMIGNADGAPFKLTTYWTPDYLKSKVTFGWVDKDRKATSDPWFCFDGKTIVDEDHYSEQYNMNSRWICLDYNEQVNITSYAFYVSRLTCDYTIQTSNDGVNFTDAVVQTSDVGSMTLTGTCNITGRYIKIWIKRLQDANTWFEFSEIELYTTAALSNISLVTNQGAQITNNMKGITGQLLYVADPTRFNYTFTGWYRDATCTQHWNKATDVITQDITLYAGWIYTGVVQISNPKIMPLGDSITDGANFSGGYRTNLWLSYAANGNNVDFVGSASGGPGELPDKSHEGHIGLRIDQIDSQITFWVSTYQPDMVLVMLGTNDMYQNYNISTAPDRLSALIDKIANMKPNAIIFVSSITPLSESILEQRALAYNAAIPGIVNTKVSEGKNVVYVDMHSAITTDDLYDGIHPNGVGYDKMGTAWFNATAPYIKTSKDYIISNPLFDHSVLKSVNLKGVKNIATENACMIAALYDSQTKALESVEVIGDVDINGNNIEQTIHFLGKISLQQDEILKFMLWNNSDEMQPLTDTYTYTLRNYIQNPEFDNGASSWGTSIMNGAKGTLSIVQGVGMSGNNALKTTVESMGTVADELNIQTLQKFPTTAGKTYTISFIAKADAARSMKVGLQFFYSPYNTYWQQTINLTTTPTKFGPYTFNCSKTDVNAALMFLLSSDMSSVYIDKVVVTITD